MEFIVLSVMLLHICKPLKFTSFSLRHSVQVVARLASIGHYVRVRVHNVTFFNQYGQLLSYIQPQQSKKENEETKRL